MLSSIVASIKLRLTSRSERTPPPPSDSPVWVSVDPQTATRRSFVVQTEQELEEQRSTATTFEYSKSSLSSIMLLTPMTAEFLEEVPMARDEMKDALVMAITMFIQIMLLVNKQESSSWDNSELKSRIALAMSISMSIKYVMDSQPLGPMFALSCLIKPGEANCSTEQMQEYVEQYECFVLENVSLYRCYSNHRIRALEVLPDMLSAASISSNVATYVEELIFFFSFHVSQWLPEYCSITECYIGPALVLLSLECLNVSGFAAKGVEPCGALQSYRLASKMAADVSARDTSRMQKMLNIPLTDSTSWQRQATTQGNIKKAKVHLDKWAASMVRSAPYR